MKTRMNCARPRIPFTLTLLAMALATAMPAYAQQDNLDVADTGLLSHNGTLDKNAADAEHVFTTDTTITATNSTYDGLAITVDGCVLLVESTHSFASVELINGATLSAPEGSERVSLTITGDLIIESSSRLLAPLCDGADSQGGCYRQSIINDDPADCWIIYNHCGAGGGHGGSGGGICNAVGGGTHGDFMTPTSVGGRGGCDFGGYGGGAIRLIVEGVVQVDGTISADGEDGDFDYDDCHYYRGGGGAGGSVYITAGSLTGSGTICARGGDGEYAPTDGGGGRIAIYCDTPFTFNQSRIRVNGYERGTIYIAAPEDCNGNEVADSEEISADPTKDMNANGVLDECESDCNLNGTVDDYEIEQGWVADCDANGIIDSCQVEQGFVADCNTNGYPDACDIAAGTSSDLNGNGFPDECETQYNLAVFSTNTTIAAGDSTYQGQAVIVDGCELLIESSQSFGSLQLINGAVVSAPQGYERLELVVTSDVSIDPTSRISAPEGGDTNSSGAIDGYYNTWMTTCVSEEDHLYGGGGGHGGGGCYRETAGSVHGDAAAPTTIGGRGGLWSFDNGSGLGGGAIRLTVGGKLHVDGTISADGRNGISRYDYGSCVLEMIDAGGGAGGSVYLTVGSIDGSGTISANGGNGGDDNNSVAGPNNGGGGRVAIYHRIDNSLDSANISVSGYEDGTIYTAQIDEFMLLADCLAGPNQSPTPSILTDAATCLTVFDFDGDGDVDLIDFANFQVNFD